MEENLLSEIRKEILHVRGMSEQLLIMEEQLKGRRETVGSVQKMEKHLREIQRDFAIIVRAIQLVEVSLVNAGSWTQEVSDRHRRVWTDQKKLNVKSSAAVKKMSQLWAMVEEQA